MASTSGNEASLGAALVLLAIGSANVGYGGCLMVHNMDGGPVLTGVGAMLIGLATIFVARARKQGNKTHDG